MLKSRRPSIQPNTTCGTYGIAGRSCRLMYLRGVRGYAVYVGGSKKQGTSDVQLVKAMSLSGARSWERVWEGGWPRPSRFWRPGYYDFTTNITIH